MPERIQLSRAKGWRKPPNTVVVSRPSMWGNPFKVGETFWVKRDGGGPIAPITPHSVEEAVEYFRWYVSHHPGRMEVVRSELAGKNLACWCALDAPCHADVLLELANGGAAGEGEAQ
jgi:hypothetical protein